MPVALLETPTLERRRFCECCGFPSLIVPYVEETRQLEDDPHAWDRLGSPWWESSACACDLCEWESRPLDEQGDPLDTAEEERNDGVTLEQARANFARFGDIYDPNDLPAWKVSAPSPEVHDARRVLREAYEALMAAAPGAQWEPWNAVLEAERNVRGALVAQQAADEEEVAGEWDDAEESDS